MACPDITRATFSTQPPTSEVLEGATTQIFGVLTQEDGSTIVPGSILTSLTLTVYVQDDALTEIVSARDILNRNGGLVDECGQLTVRLDPADMVIVHPELPHERHIVFLAWTWGTDPSKTGYAEIALALRNLVKVS